MKPSLTLSRENHSPSLNCWKPLTVNALKFNVDGSFISSSVDARIAIVVRNSNSLLVDGFCDIVKSPSVATNEAFAINKAL